MKVKTLGVQWLSHHDLLSYKVDILNSVTHSSVTKRILLSSIARIYDPMGLVSPCIVLVKILIPKLWFLKIQWDDVVPADIAKQWESNLRSLNELKIPRCVFCEHVNDVQVHGLSDASLSAYSAVVYVHTTDSSGDVCVRLLCAKTKVAPVKKLTIPRLELCGALMLTRLMKQVSEVLTYKFESFYWCDSQVVLSWLKSGANSLQVFVANRISEIQQFSDISRWSYVNTKENPADVASRRMQPNDLC